MAIPILEQIKEINRKYAKPQIETTIFVKVCLITLRVYLVTLIGLLLYKFLTVIKH